MKTDPLFRQATRRSPLQRVAAQSETGGVIKLRGLGLGMVFGYADGCRAQVCAAPEYRTNV